MYIYIYIIYSSLYISYCNYSCILVKKFRRSQRELIIEMTCAQKKCANDRNWCFRSREWVATHEIDPQEIIMDRFYVSIFQRSERKRGERERKVRDFFSMQHSKFFAACPRWTRPWARLLQSILKILRRSILLAAKELQLK